MYDAIIVGARVAGSPTAMLLAQKGYKVLLLDRDTFPSDTISTHILFSRGFSRLKKWGLSEKVLASGCPQLNKVTFDLGPFALTGTPPSFQNTTENAAPRRYILDKILLDAAVEAGAELRENCIVEELIMSEGRVTGVRCKTKEGKSFTEYGRIAIGADGRNSVVAREVKAHEYNAVPKVSCWFYSYWSGVDIDNLTLYALPYNAVGFIPTNDDLICLTVACLAGEFMSFRKDIEGNYLKAIAQVESLRDKMQDAKRESRITAMADLPNFYRQSYGPGWALVGDAGYHKDPITGQGMSDAIIYAEKLAEAIDAGFSGKENLMDALEKYQTERDEATLPMYHFTCDFAKLEPPTPEMEALFFAMQGNQQAIDQFVGTVCGSFPVNEFFAPENLQRIMGVATV